MATVDVFGLVIYDTTTSLQEISLPKRFQVTPVNISVFTKIDNTFLDGMPDPIAVEMPGGTYSLTWDVSPMSYAPNPTTEIRDNGQYLITQFHDLIKAEEDLHAANLTDQASTTFYPRLQPDQFKARLDFALGGEGLTEAQKNYLVAEGQNPDVINGHMTTYLEAVRNEVRCDEEYITKSAIPMPIPFNYRCAYPDCHAADERTHTWNPYPDPVNGEEEQLNVN